MDIFRIRKMIPNTARCVGNVTKVRPEALCSIFIFMDVNFLPWLMCSLSVFLWRILRRNFREVAFAKCSNSASSFKHAKCVSELPLLWQNLGVMLHSLAQRCQTPFVNAAKGLFQATMISPHVNVRLDLVKSLEVKSDPRDAKRCRRFACLFE